MLTNVSVLILAQAKCTVRDAPEFKSQHFCLRTKTLLAKFPHGQPGSQDGANRHFLEKAQLRRNAMPIQFPANDIHGGT